MFLIIKCTTFFPTCLLKRWCKKYWYWCTKRYVTWSKMAAQCQGQTIATIFAGSYYTTTYYAALCLLPNHFRCIRKRIRRKKHVPERGECFIYGTRLCFVVAFRGSHSTVDYRSTGQAINPACGGLFIPEFKMCKIRLTIPRQTKSWNVNYKKKTISVS